MTGSSPSAATLKAADPPRITPSAFVAAVGAVLLKDARAEFRTRYALNAVVLFAVTALVTVAMSVDGNDLSADARAALLWTVVFFAAMSGLHRTFVREEETRTADALRLSTPPVAVYLGKWAFNLALLVALEVVITVLFVVMMHVRVSAWGWYLAALLLGDLGLVTVCTSMAALVARARTQSALFAVICFPLIVPVLKLAVTITSVSLGGLMKPTLLPSAQALFAFAGLMFTASVMLFEIIWQEA